MGDQTLTNQKQIHLLLILDEHQGEIHGTEEFAARAGLACNETRFRSIVHSTPLITVIQPSVNGRGHRTIYRRNRNSPGYPRQR